MSRAVSLSKIDNTGSRKKNKINLTPIDKTLPIFNVYLKQYPLDVPEDVIEVVKMIEPLQSDFSQNLKSLKMYKQQLGIVFEQNWCDFLTYLKTIIVKMNKRTQKLIAEKETKNSLLFETIKKIEIEKIQLQNKLQKINSLRQLENAQLLMANNQLEIVNREMQSIYKILQSDMGQVMLYLTTLEQNKEKLDEKISNQMNASLNNLSTLLDTVEREQNETGQNLASMKEMIKAMTKSVKVTTGTQVDESELQLNVGAIFARDQTSVPLDVAQGVSVNLSSMNQGFSAVEKMKVKEKDVPHEKYLPKKSIDKPWALTPTLLIFLENMSKQNEVGRVLPWPYVKDIIAQVYDERIKYQTQISTSIVGNSMSFDEFLIFNFITRFKMRRLAEVKLLEFIISLKYYSKFWIRAQTFCCLMDVMKFQPYSDPSEASIYKFDHYAQNYFFSIYKYVRKFKLIHDDDGTVYAGVQYLRRLVKVALFFTDDLSKSRILSKLQKNIRTVKKIECCDLDFVLQLILEEYFAVKKRNFALINKSFSRLYDKNKGFFSVNQLSDVFDCLSSMFKKSDESVQRYPIQSQLYVGKLYMHSVTSGRNNNEILSNNFLASVQKYGFDCPYPFVKAAVVNKKNIKKEQQLEDKEQLQRTISALQRQVLKTVQPLEKQIDIIANKVEQVQISKSLNVVRIETGAKLFSQHFSILKQLNDYVKIFGQTLGGERDSDKLWKSFDQIRVILQRGCQFLKYPLVKERVK